MGVLDFIGDVVGAVVGAKSVDKTNQMNKEALQNSVLWRVEDAKRAGIHPLYAMGAPTFGPYAQAFTPDLSSMGQNLSRAIESMRSKEERANNRSGAIVNADPGDAAYHALQLENMSLQNDLLRSQIARTGADQVGPPAPSVGANVVPIPAMPIMPGTNKGTEAGVITDRSFARTPSGGLVVVPSSDMKQRIEDSPMEWEWFWRNKIVPNFTGGAIPPSPKDYPLPKGYEWGWNARAGEWRARRTDWRNGPNRRTGGF